MKRRISSGAIRFETFRRIFVQAAICLLAGLALFAGNEVRADLVTMQNGDHYTGNVISLNADTLVLQSEVLGTVHVPRGRVAFITLGSNVTARAASPVSLPMGKPLIRTTATNNPADLSAAFQQLGTNSAMIRQVQSQFLSGAGPEANQKFNELIGSLASGRMSLSDLRAQAKTSADQLRAIKRELGDDDTGTLDGYLSILDDFVKESGPPDAANVK